MESQIKELVLALPGANGELAAAYVRAEPLLSVFLPDYTYSYAVGKIVIYLKNLRADSIKEAVNLYETEEWQNRMLNEKRRQTSLQIQQLATQQQILDSNNRIEEYASRAALAAEDAAFTNRIIAANTAASAAYNRAAMESADRMANYALSIRNALY